MFKVNSKDTRTTPIEQVNAGWERRDFNADFNLDVIKVFHGCMETFQNNQRT